MALDCKALVCCAARGVAAAARKAASALPAMQRPKLERVTGSAPMKQLRRIRTRTTNVTPRMAFLRRPRKNVPHGATSASLTGPVWQYRDRIGLNFTYWDSWAPRRPGGEPILFFVLGPLCHPLST